MVRTNWVQIVVAARMPIILLALIVFASIVTQGRFTRVENLVNVARQVSSEGIIALGMTLIIITGGIDLSVGSLMALCGVVASIVMEKCLGAPPLVAIGAGLVSGVAMGAAVGGLSGSIIARGAIPPFIVTLVAMLMTRGSAFILCNGQPVHNLPPELVQLGRGFVWPALLGNRLPIPVLIAICTYVTFAFLLSRTVLGRAVVAIGSNEEAARLAGIPVGRTKLIVYSLTGALCGLAAVLHTGKLMSGDPRAGEMWELNVIAAVVVGGTSLTGGRGSMTGTVIGALIIGILNNSLNLLQVEHFWQKIVLGAVILAAALADAALRRLER